MPEAKIGEIDNCAQTCVSPFFRSATKTRSMSDRDFVETWIFSWVIACGVVSVITGNLFEFLSSRVTIRLSNQEKSRHFRSAANQSGLS